MHALIGPSRRHFICSPPPSSLLSRIKPRPFDSNHEKGSWSSSKVLGRKEGGGGRSGRVE